MKVFSTVAAILALASAEPEPGYHNNYYRSYSHGGVAHHPYGATSYRGRTVYGYPSRSHYIHKREAEADAEPGYGYNYGYNYGHPVVSYSHHAPAYGHHSYGGSSYVGRTVYGYPSRSHYVHKREAEADAEPGYGYTGRYYQPRSYSFGYDVHQSHPGYAHSYQSVHQAGGHYLHKREAEADAEPGYGYSGYSGHYYQPRSYSSGYNVHQSHPGYARSYQSVHRAGGHYLHKREADAEPGYGYSGHGYSSYRSKAYGHGYARATSYVAPTTYAKATSYVAPTTYGYPSHGYNYGGHRSYYH